MLLALEARTGETGESQADVVMEEGVEPGDAAAIPGSLGIFPGVAELPAAGIPAALVSRANGDLMARPKRASETRARRGGAGPLAAGAMRDFRTQRGTTGRPWPMALRGRRSSRPGSSRRRGMWGLRSRPSMKWGSKSRSRRDRDGELAAVALEEKRSAEAPEEAWRDVQIETGQKL